MRIFLSFASERRKVADSLAAELRGYGHRVFLDRDDLPPGEAYDARIRRQIEASDLFLFLISPESVARGRYTRTEIDIARERWPRPAGRVLPVIVAKTPREGWPDYLRAVTVFEPREDMVKETALEVERLRRRQPVLRLGPVVAPVAGMVGLAMLVFLLASTQDVHIPAAFAIRGNHAYPTWGEVVTMGLLNVKPQALSSYTCRIVESPEAVNIATIEHDPQCREIRLTLAEGPFVDAAGQAVEIATNGGLGSQLWEGARLEVLDEKGDIAWSGEIRVALSNVMSFDHFALAGLPGDGGTSNRRRYRPLFGKAYSTRLEHRGEPLGAGFECSVDRPLFGGVKAVELIPKGGCAFELSPGERRGSSPLAGAGQVTILVSHPASGWSLALYVDFVFERQRREG